MSVTPLQRVVIAGTRADKAASLEGLQELGSLHLIPLDPEGIDTSQRATSVGARAQKALRYLLGASLKRHQVESDDGFDIVELTERALANRRRKLEIQERIDELQARIKHVEPWGHFELPAREDLAGHRLWFYVVPHYQLRKITTDHPWEIVHRDSRFSYLVVVSADLPEPGSIPVPRSRLGTRSLDELRRLLDRAEADMDEARAERWALTRFISLMIRDLARAEDASSLTQAGQGALDAGEIFAVSGWAPASEADAIRSFCQRQGLACAFEDPGPDDDPPVRLENAPSMAPGEDLVTFYQLPGYRDWDPSPVIHISFALFFGMILADAAYGAIFGLITLILWPRMARTGSLRRGRKILGAITAASVAYGVLVGSYFGLTPPPGSFLARLQVLDVNDFQSMMTFSIGIGALHLILGNAVAAWGRRRSATALAPFGWMLAIAGGFAALLGQTRPGVGAAIAGLVLVFVFSSPRPIRKASDLAWRVVDGLLELTRVSQAFGDILSYLRLFALGLASASLAVTFNQLAGDIMGAGRGLALLVGLLILVIGHGLNFILGLVSGVVHGLRLNVIELYNWSIFGEGHPFEPFEKTETRVVAESTVRRSGQGLL